MGEGINWAETNEDGEFTLPKRFRGIKAAPEVPVTVRIDGYQPITQIAASDSANMTISLAEAAGRKIPLCKQAPKRTFATMRFTLPTGAGKPRGFSDADYAGIWIEFRNDAKTFYLRIMSGSLCCGGHALARTYLRSNSISETAWSARLRDRLIAGMDSRGTNSDGTHWRWIGPLVGEQADYEGADDEAAKYFDSILDTLCISPRR